MKHHHGGTIGWHRVRRWDLHVGVVSVAITSGRAVSAATAAAATTTAAAAATAAATTAAAATAAATATTPTATATTTTPTVVSRDEQADVHVGVAVVIRQRPAPGPAPARRLKNAGGRRCLLLWLWRGIHRGGGHVDVYPRHHADASRRVAVGGADAAGVQLQRRAGARLAAEAGVDAHLVQLLGKEPQPLVAFESFQRHGQNYVLELGELLDHQQLVGNHLG